MQPKVILPPRLFPGARVALIAPSGPLLERDDLARGEELCRALGWNPVISPHAGGAHGYLAGTDAERLADLNTALTDPAVDGVWCLRGGQGLNRILDGVDFEGFARKPKPVIGYSDVTVLLLGIWTTTGVITFHGQMARVQMPAFTRRAFAGVLQNPVAMGRLERAAVSSDTLVPAAGRVITIVPGKAQGRLVGGNLTMLQALAGSRYFPELEGAILFLEDIGEHLYRIDRMLAHLRMIGALKGLAGAAIGHFTNMKRATEDGGFGLDDVLHTYFDPLGVPVAAGFPIGHIDDQWTIPIGAIAEIDATNGDLTLLSRAVA